jgi:uncharacterized protein YkwD
MRRMSIVAALAMVTLLAGWTAVAQACRGARHAPAKLTIEEAQRAMVCSINHRRKNNGRRALRVAPTLVSAAQSHSQAMVANDFFSHEGDGTPASRAAAAGYMGGGTFMIGETLGWGGGRFGTPHAVVGSMMSSASHRAVILARGFRQIGVGVAMGSPMGADGGNVATYTVDFGRRGG